MFILFTINLQHMFILLTTLQHVFIYYKLPYKVCSHCLPQVQRIYFLVTIEHMFLFTTSSLEHVIFTTATKDFGIRGRVEK